MHSVDCVILRNIFLSQFIRLIKYPNNKISVSSFQQKYSRLWCFTVDMVFKGKNVNKKLELCEATHELSIPLDKSLFFGSSLRKSKLEDVYSFFCI